MADFLPVTRLRLPKSRQYALTWGIPDNFGGMTSAMLHRSRALVSLTKRPVDVLTFDARPDYPTLEAELRAAGEFIDGMRLMNLYDFFRDTRIPENAAGSLDLKRHPFTPLDAGPSHLSAFRGDIELSRTRRAEDGTVLQVDHFREDGSLLLSDRRDAHVRGDTENRSVVLCDGNGQPVRSWARMWSFYRFWLDLARNREPSIMIVDSKTVATFMLTYRRKLATTMHVVHNSHLSSNDRPLAPLRESRRPVFEHLEDFDAVVLLTPRQKQDVETLLGPAGNLCVIPNSRRLHGHRRTHERPPGGGIVIASLINRKRVDHAVRAAADAARRTDCRVTLDVFGDGPKRDSLQKLITDLEADDRIRLHGHRSDAREHLAESSFIVLTGSTEGLPLVLVEAMAAGCVPIAYDVPYGAADVIDDGRNGFLIEEGDQRALADAIAAVGALSPDELARMRRDARRTASRFSDASVTRLWAREMREAQRRHQAVFGRRAGRARRALRLCRRALAWPVRQVRLRTARRQERAAAEVPADA
ncbi:glycosyltransferase [Streptomyces albidus (ex Kaewkla and Franco 2022)]|uniref:glycosyltransferase n=1 Tax=Streptomyces albidus (ex Kaewkla and Franco 2022) TaxID=722709 RepID=UPI0015EF4D85|nr:glycosyltransferase [Streptomyces albidus (ex Kaewkla and Franco 2022)]